MNVDETPAMRQQLLPAGASLVLEHQGHLCLGLAALEWHQHQPRQNPSLCRHPLQGRGAPVGVL